MKLLRAALVLLLIAGIIAGVYIGYNALMYGQADSQIRQLCFQASYTFTDDYDCDTEADIAMSEAGERIADCWKANQDIFSSCVSRWTDYRIR